MKTQFFHFLKFKPILLYERNDNKNFGAKNKIPRKSTQPNSKEFPSAKPKTTGSQNKPTQKTGKTTPKTPNLKYRKTQ